MNVAVLFLVVLPFSTAIPTSMKMGTDATSMTAVDNLLDEAEVMATGKFLGKYDEERGCEVVNAVTEKELAASHCHNIYGVDSAPNAEEDIGDYIQMGANQTCEEFFQFKEKIKKNGNYVGTVKICKAHPKNAQCTSGKKKIKTRHPLCPQSPSPSPSPPPPTPPPPSPPPCDEQLCLDWCAKKYPKRTKQSDTGFYCAKACHFPEVYANLPLTRFKGCGLESKPDYKHDFYCQEPPDTRYDYCLDQLGLVGGWNIDANHNPGWTFVGPGGDCNNGKGWCSHNPAMREICKYGCEYWKTLE